VLTKQPDYLPALLGITELSLEKHEFDDFEPVIQRLAGLQHGPTWIPVIRARMSMANQDFTAARNMLETAIATSPKEVIFRIVHSHALLQEGKDWPAAEQAPEGDSGIGS
jgi:predicted Zn-dependent protease